VLDRVFRYGALFSEKIHQDNDIIHALGVNKMMLVTRVKEKILFVNISFCWRIYGQKIAHQRTNSVNVRSNLGHLLLMIQNPSIKSSLVFGYGWCPI